MTRKLYCYAAGVLSALLSIGVHANTETKEIVFGSVAMDTPAVMHERLKPLTNYLTKVLNREVRLKLAPDMPAAIKDLSSATVDLAYLTPVAYLRSHDTGNTRLLAKTVTNKQSSFQLMIVVAEKSPIQSVEQLAGKRFAFGDKAALLQRATVVGAGMPLDKLGSYEFLGHYDNIVRAVLRGHYDAGILKDTMAFKWKGKGIRILYSTPQLPPYNIAVSSKVDEKTFNSLRQAFLSLDVNNSEHREVIKALDKKYDGFAPTDDTEYDIVRKLIAPFDKK